ncbi:MAG: class I SAM-dependent methyltransferase [Vicinamibacterales bacterium]
MPPFDLAAAAPSLRPGADGIWTPPTQSALDYPDEGNAFCFQVEDHSFWFRYRNERIVETVRRFPPGGASVDIGAGNGFVARGLTQAGFPTVVVEPGPVGARNARARGLDPVVCASLDDAGFLPGSLPAAGMFDVLEHLADDRAVLTTLARLLRPDGRLYLTVPAYSWLWSDDDVLAGHHRRYTRGSLTRVVEAAGFALETDTYLFAPLVLPILLLRSIPSALRTREPANVETLTRELRPKEGFAERLVARTLALEAWWFGHVGAVPFGSSVLLVARRR